MKNKITVWLSLAIIMSATITACSALPVSQLAVEAQAAPAYQMISVDELDDRMREDDLFLVNVHIPLEGNIPGTDQTIPYNAVEDYLDSLPADKDQPIYLYCRSDSMGHTAARTLLDLGYTRVYNLEGGYIAWRAAGLPFVE